MKDRHIGSSFDDFLEEDGIKEEVTIEAYKKVVEQLKAERLELAKEIFNKWKHIESFYYDLPEYGCSFCDLWEEDVSGHSEDCIVLKAEKIIKE